MDLQGFFERIDAHYKRALPFVAYRKPNKDEVIALLQKDKSKYTLTNYSESGFVFAPFDDREDTILIPLEHSERLSTMTGGIIPLKNSAKQIKENEPEKIFHKNLVHKGIETIKKGNLKKVVLSRKETIILSDNRPIEIFKRLLDNYPSAFVYCFYHPGVGTWLGATPEMLLKIKGHKFFTTALAGTQKYEGTLDVVWGSKEKEEQQLVTNFIVDYLQPLVNHLNVEKVETIKAGSLLHLKTNISGSLDFDRLKLKQLLSALHPTPAVCGIPKERAKQFIIDYEQYHREYYTGFLGELNIKEKKLRKLNHNSPENDAVATSMAVSNLFVNLRCMQLKANQAIIYVGGGITIDSKPEAEWDETVNKSQTIKSVL